MRKEIILKVILILIMGAILFVRPVNVLAVSSDAADLNDLTGYEDLGSKSDLTTGTTDKTTDATNTNTMTNINTTTNSTNTTTNTSTTNTTTATNTETTQKKDELPKAGLATDTMMIIVVVGLVAMAIYTFKKVNEYNNI